MSRDIGYTCRPILLCISKVEFTNRSVAEYDLPKSVSVRRPDASARADIDRLEAEIDEQSTSWNDRLRAAAIAELGEVAGSRLYDLLGDSTSAAYRAAVSPDREGFGLNVVDDIYQDYVMTILGGNLEFAERRAALGERTRPRDGP